MSKYLKYVIENIEPVRIADDATSQSGQTNTLKYIPGSAIRGLVISHFAECGNLDQYKADLFSDKICFMNAYLTTKKHSLIPSLKGFYEDKTDTPAEKPLTNVFLTETLDGKKRASLGEFCYVDHGTVYYYKVRTGADLKIKINLSGNEKRNVFRNEYIASGQYFEGYIKLNGSAADEHIIEYLKSGNCIILGNARSAGLGKCMIRESEILNELPLHFKGFEAQGSCYMVLLSDTVMRDENLEYCGIDISLLGQKLGVENLKIEKAATSIRKVKGYNRTMGIKLPSVPMYEKGSVFKLTFEGTISASVMENLINQGIGVRKNEGFGRICFLDNFEIISCKKPMKWQFAVDDSVRSKACNLNQDELATLKIAAKGYYHFMLKEAMEAYAVDHPLKTGGISNSKLGTIESIITMYSYDYQKAKTTLKDFFKHEKEKAERQNIQKEKKSLDIIEKEIFSILNSNLNAVLFGENHSFTKTEQVMGIPINDFFAEDDGRYKLALLIDMIRFTRKEN